MGNFYKSDISITNNFLQKVDLICELTHDLVGFTAAADSNGHSNALDELIKNKIFKFCALETTVNIDRFSYAGKPVLFYQMYNKDLFDMSVKNSVDPACLYNNPSLVKSFTRDEILKDISKISKAYLPKTVYRFEDVKKLKFPVIAKHNNSFQGRGVKKFDTFEDLKSNLEDFDVFQELIKIKTEYRILCFKGKSNDFQILTILEKVPIKVFESKDMSDKSKSMKFNFIQKDLKSFNVNGFSEMLSKTAEALPGLNIFGFDICVDESDKWFIIEVNAAPGLGTSQAVFIYKAIYEDFYKSEFPKQYLHELEILAQTLFIYTKTNSPSFESENNAHLNFDFIKIKN